MFYLFLYTSGFHNKLKSGYLGGKVNRRVDDLLHVLLRIEKDQFFQFMEKMKMSPLNRLDIKETGHHKKGLEIPANSVKVTIGSVKIYIQVTTFNNYIEN